MNIKNLLVLLACLAGASLFVMQQHYHKQQPITGNMIEEEPIVEAAAITQVIKTVEDTAVTPAPAAESITPSIDAHNAAIITTPMSSQDAQQSNKRHVSVKNNITEKMIAYTKAFMQYVPDFSITVNNVPLAQGKAELIELDDDKLIVEYKYNFCNGYKTGFRRIEFVVPQEKDEVSLNFSWKDDWRVIIPGIQPNKVLAEES